MKLKRFVSAAAAFMLLFAFTCASAEEYYDADGNKYETGVKIYVNDQELDVSGAHPAVVLNDHTMVPMRVIFETLGASVEWNEAEQAVTATRDNRGIKMKIDSPLMSVFFTDEGLTAITDIVSDTAPVLMPYNGTDTTMVPLRVVSEALGCDVRWSDEDFAVHITDEYTEAKPTESPIPEASDINVTAQAQYRIDIDDNSIVFIKDDGTVWQGDINKSDYTKVDGLSGVIAVANARNAFYALSSNGEVYSWGTSNTFGQLGRDGDMAVPAKVEGLSNIVKIDAGVSFGAALDKSGKLCTWGRGDHGQLGTGSDESVSRPTAVQQLDSVKDFAAGPGGMVAVNKDGRVYTWGENGEGQLGRNISSTSHRSSPGLIKTMYNIERVYAGPTSSAAIRNDKSIYYWGTTYLGAPAEDEEPLELIEGVFAETDDEGYMLYEKPLRVRQYEYDIASREDLTGVLLGADTVSCGEYQAAAICGGALFLWGDSPMMKHTSASQQRRYCAQRYANLSGVTAVYAGYDREVYALDQDGILWELAYNNKREILSLR